LYIRRWASIVSIVIRLQVGWSGVQFLAGPGDVSLLQNVQTSSGSHSDSYSMHTRVLSPESSGNSVKVTTHLYLVSKVRKSGAIPLLPSSPLWCGQGQLYIFAKCIFFFTFKFFSDLILINLSGMIMLHYEIPFNICLTLSEHTSRDGRYFQRQSQSSGSPQKY
jgi:hypothetical protein